MGSNQCISVSAAPAANGEPDGQPCAAPADLCGYPVASVLLPGQTYLAIGAGGRGVVLKKLDPECLHRGLLHPSIRERLCRVRELAHAGVANLHGVGRDGDAAYLIWEYVEGTPFGDYAASPERTQLELAVLARELVLGVDSLHMQGIVHGALSAANVIVAPDKSIRLTHVSPLLYEDRAADGDAVLALLEAALEQRGEEGSPLGLLLADTRAEGGELSDLRPLGSRLAAFIESRDTTTEAGTTRTNDRHVRRRALLGAAAVAVMGLAIAYGVWHAVDGGGVDLHTAWPFSRLAGK